MNQSYSDTLIYGVIGLVVSAFGWLVRTVFTDTKRIQKTETILTNVTAILNEHKIDVRLLREENKAMAVNQSRIITLIENLDKRST